MTHSRCLGLPVRLALLIGTFLLAGALSRAQSPTTPQPATRWKLVEPQKNWVRAVLADSQAAPVRDALDRDVQNAELLLSKLQEPGEERLGATLQPVEDTLRAQLDLPSGQGLLVTALRNEGPSALAGLKQNDILLSLGGKPLASVEDLTKQLKAAGDAVVPLQLLRAGKPLTLSVRPVYEVTLGPVVEQKSEYFLGVSIDSPDDAVRAQLALPEGQGVVVSDVVSASPAEKAGIKKHDILLELGGKAIDNPQTLTQQVQANQEKPTTLKILRAGKPVTMPITPGVRQVETSAAPDALRFWLVDAGLDGTKRWYRNAAAVQPERGVGLVWSVNGESLEQRLTQLESDIKALRAAIEQLTETLRNDKARKRE